MAKSSVIYTIKNYSDCGDCKSKSRSGRPRKINERNIRHLVAHLRQNPSLTSDESANSFIRTTNESISSSCIRRNLLRIGLRSFSARKKPFMTEAAMKKRVKWCKKYKDMPVDFWKKVMFSDETMVEIHPFNAINRVRRFSLENSHQRKYICPKQKFRLKVMF